MAAKLKLFYKSSQHWKAKPYYRRFAYSIAFPIIIVILNELKVDGIFISSHVFV